jgi:hypothetical protein
MTKRERESEPGGKRCKKRLDSRDVGACGVSEVGPRQERMRNERMARIASSGQMLRWQRAGGPQWQPRAARDGR